MATEQVARGPDRRPYGERPLARSLRAWAVVALYGYLVALVVGPKQFQFWREFGLQNLTLALVVAYVLVTLVTDPRYRSWRIPLAGWPVAFLAGNLLLNAHLSGTPPAALEATSVGVTLLAYPCAVLTILQIHRGRWRGVNRSTFLDSCVAALAIWATFTAFVLPAAARAVDVGHVDPLLVLAFPICDLSVLTLTVVAVAQSGERPERMSGWLLLAIIICGLGDSAYGVGNALGTWRYGTPMDGIWVVGCALVGLGAGAGPPSTRTTRTWGAGVLVVPLVSSAVALSLLVAGTRWPLPPLAVALAAASVAVALLRVADAYVKLWVLAETQRLAATDDLTALANRRAFYQTVEHRLNRDRPLALMLIDLDRFKEVNDTLGHGVGDDLLHLVARRLESGMPEGGLLARLGGDEFAACVDLPPAVTAVDLPSAVTPAVVDIGEHLLATLQVPMVVGGRTLTVGASLGAAVHPAPDRGTQMSRTELMRRADVAMYAAKRSGGGVRVHQPGDDATLVIPGQQGRHRPLRARHG